MNNTSLLKGSWDHILRGEIQSARKEVVVSSPYVSTYGIDALTTTHLDQERNRIEIHFLTNLSPINLISGATDPRALVSLSEKFRSSRIYHLRNLHAKVYIFDAARAIVTSENLTYGGLKANQEYGILISNEETAKQIRRDILDCTNLATEITQSQLANYCEATDKASHAYKQQLMSASTAAKQAYADSLRIAEDRLIELQLNQGPIHSVFERTAYYFFAREKALTTEQLHARIQSTHPELCDDTVDRVINGQHFGKRWKHVVRTVHQQLKAKGLIKNENGVWRLIE